MMLLLALPIIAITVILGIYAYRAILQQTNKTFQSISAIMGIAIYIASDDHIESIISNIETINDPRIAANGLALSLAVLTYYALKTIMNIEGKRAKPNKAL